MKERLEKAARQQQRSKSFLAGQAIAEYLSVQDWQDRRVLEALDAANSGKGIAHDRVKTWIETFGSDTPDKMPEE